MNKMKQILILISLFCIIQLQAQTKTFKIKGKQEIHEIVAKNGNLDISKIKIVNNK